MKCEGFSLIRVVATLSPGTSSAWRSVKKARTADLVHEPWSYRGSGFRKSTPPPPPPPQSPKTDPAFNTIQGLCSERRGSVMLGQLTLHVLEVFSSWALQLPWLVSIHLHKSFRTLTLYYLWLDTFNTLCSLQPVTYVTEAKLSAFCVCYDTSASALQFHYHSCIIIRIPYQRKQC